MMHFVDMVRVVQIPLLAAVLLGGCTTKFAHAFRLGSLDVGLGPTALFPVRLRRPLAVGMCAVECGLGIGLIVTAGRIGRGAPATCVRLGTTLLFLVATCALLELRAARPDIGCGCFGDFSTSPVTWRALTRSALLSVGALSTIGLPPVRQPHPGAAAAVMLGTLGAELTLIACLSPELSEALVRLGYSEPCELRILPSDRSLTALRRSKQWRRYAGLITADVPTDVWRELCWRYLVFPVRHGNRDAEIVFAVFLRQRRPLIHTALVDATTCEALPWPAPAGFRWRAGPAWLRRQFPHRARPAARGQSSASSAGSAGSAGLVGPGGLAGHPALPAGDEGAGNAP